MILRKLEIMNFKSFLGSKTIEYEEGVNLIIADNGKGKSTQADAISLLLLGINPSKNLEELINWDAPKTANKFEIASEFEENGKEYRSEMVVEKVGKSIKTNRVLSIAGEVVAEGAETVTDYLKDIFDPTLTDNALFLKQNGNQIVDITDANRRDVLKKMNDIDYTLKVKKEIEPEIARLKQEVIEIDKKIYALEQKTYDPRIVKEVPFIESTYKDLMKQKEGLQAEITLVKTKVDEKAEKETELEKVESDTKVQEANILVSRSKIMEAEESIASNSTKESDERATIEGKIKDTQSILKTLEGGFDSNPLTQTSERACNTLDNAIGELEGSLDNYPTKRISKFDEEPLKYLILTKNTCENTIESLKKSIASMKEGCCPTCGRAYEASTITETEELLETEGKKLLDLDVKIDVLEKEKMDHTKKVEDNQTNITKKTEITNTITAKKKEKETLTSQLKTDIENGDAQNKKDLETTKQTLDLHKEKLENVSDIYKAKLITLENTIKTLEEGIDSSEKATDLNKEKTAKLEKEISQFNIESISAKETELRTISSKVSEYDRVLTENETIKEFNVDLIKEEKKDKEYLADNRAIKDKLLTLQLDNSTAKDVLLKDLPNYIISMGLSELEDNINTFIDGVYDRSLNIGFRQNKASIELKYGRNATNLKTAKGGLSGAEAQLVNLAFVDSFNSKLGLGCIWLDEPDSAMSDSNAMTLYESIGEMTEKYNQVILVTHKTKLKSFIENQYNANIISL